MKKNLIAPILIWCAALTTLASPAMAGQKVKVDKYVINEYGDISIGLVVPDSGMTDPHAWVENGRVYVFCGHDKSWEPVNTWVMDRWEVWSTKDLLNWRHETNILPTDTYIGDEPNCWAGDICERDGKYYWFFSNRNINSGVVVADKITGPYKDLLGKPLLEEDLTPVHEYDPDVFIDDDGEYYLCFGNMTYYMSRLSEDMKSLAEEPRPIEIRDEKGEIVIMGDKPTLFKRGEWYYLSCGNRYSMSKSLFGPYDYKGTAGSGAHCGFFEFKGQWYKVHETSDTNNFYRGVSMQPVYFNEDGTMFYAKISSSAHSGGGRNYTFKASEMAWHADCGTTFEYNKKKESIKGQITAKNAAIESAIFLNFNPETMKSFKLDIRNETSSTRVRLGLATYNPTRLFWLDQPAYYDWSEGSFIDVEVEPNSKEMQHIEVPVSEFKGLKSKIFQLRVEPATDAESGKWEIDNIIIQ